MTSRRKMPERDGYSGYCPARYLSSQLEIGAQSGTSQKCHLLSSLGIVGVLKT